MAESNGNAVRVIFPALSENEQLARAFAGAVASKLDPTLREMDEIKTAVSEAVTNAVVHAYPKEAGEVALCMSAENGVFRISVTDTGIGIADIERAREASFTTSMSDERSGLGFTVMEAFMDEVSVESHIGKGTTVKMKKRIRG